MPGAVNYRLAFIPSHARSFILQADADEILQLTSSLKTEDVELNEEVIRLFASGAAGSLSPMQAVIGGIAAQEVLKVGSFG